MATTPSAPASTSAAASAAAAASSTTKSTSAASASSASSITSTTTTTTTTKKKKSTPKKSKASGETGAEPKKKKARRKKPKASAGGGGAGGGSGSGAMSAADIQENGRLAQLEVSQQRALAAARKSDPLWYSTQEALASVSSEAVLAPGILEDQVALVETALSNNRLSRADVTPQAFGCLLEQGRRYALELLADGQDYAYLANRQDVTKADLLMAVELRPDGTTFGGGATSTAAAHTQHHKLVVVSHQVNRRPLPPIPEHCYTGVVLPPKEKQVTSRTFDIVSGAQTASRMTSKLPQPKTSTTPKKTSPSSTTSTTTSSNNKSSSKSASYGVKKGTQIPIQLTKKPGSKPAAAATTTTPTAGQQQQPTVPSTTTGTKP
eukprot:CAMPEP_0194041058 /NCGR_PEP_ID=MMETSP0009_2-20130614/12963_1 /TAXON_ID=210454 /ORGANISM="Grammatophora oceanica, Strain CCMP 410" /LENGTH=377 /DNA_ID=CAMNT_0038684393 /DNA_START=35 /DNA_END=1168 /DNA_ORIENTATION=+